MRIFAGDINIFIFVAAGRRGRRPLQDKEATNIRYGDFCILVTSINYDLLAIAEADCYKIEKILSFFFKITDSLLTKCVSGYIL